MSSVKHGCIIHFQKHQQQIRINISSFNVAIALHKAPVSPPRIQTWEANYGLTSHGDTYAPYETYYLPGLPAKFLPKWLSVSTPIYTCKPDPKQWLLTYQSIAVSINT